MRQHLFFTAFVVMVVYTGTILGKGSVPVKRKLIVSVLLCVLLLSVRMDAWAMEGKITVRTAEACHVTIYKVAAPEGMNYRLLECYGGGLMTFDDTLSPDLAAWLAGRVKDGITKETEQGAAEFFDLEEGLYLVVQTGDTETFAPFFVSIPWDGSMWQVEVTPFPEESPQTGDEIYAYFVLWIVSAMAVVLVQRKWHA